MEDIKENPLFTVIIPTKDRAEYLYHTLRTCANQDYENLEIIVSDDGSQDNTKEIVLEAARKDSRIRYISPGSGVGMLENFEFALNHVKPGYVFALGGDDGLLPNCIRRMRDILFETQQELLAWSIAMFFYPGVRTENGQLFLPHNRGKLLSGIKIINSKQFLERQSKLLYYVSDDESPMIYVKGVVSTRLVDQVKKRSVNGKFYSCSTPDGYSGIILAGEVDKYVFCYEPLTIYGSSPTSQGAAYLNKGEVADNLSAAFFKNVEKHPMHKELASQSYSPLISLMTADFLLTAKDQLGWPGEFPSIDFKNLINKSLKELEHGIFSEDNMVREFYIIKAIAKQKGLTTYFEKRLRKFRKDCRKPVQGNSISSKLLSIDAKKSGISNIFDAAYVTHFAFQIFSKLRATTFWKMVINSIKYKILSFKKRKKLSQMILDQINNGN